MNDLFDFNEYTERITHVILEKVNETTDELIVDAIFPFARSVEYRINKVALKKAIRMYYGKENVAEVVRCKDCKYYSKIGRCGVLGFCEPDEFCSRGERRKSDAEIH